MRLTNLIIFLFLIAAFTIGAQYTPAEIGEVQEVIDLNLQNLTNIELINLESTDDTYTTGILQTIEKYVQFIMTASLTVIKLGVQFGNENPEYFKTTFLLQLFKYLIIIYAITLLAKPLLYLIILLILPILWLKERKQKRRTNGSQIT